MDSRTPKITPPERMPRASSMSEGLPQAQDARPTSRQSGAAAHIPNRSQPRPQVARPQAAARPASGARPGDQVLDELFKSEGWEIYTFEELFGSKEPGVRDGAAAAMRSLGCDRLWIHKATRARYLVMYINDEAAGRSRNLFIETVANDAIQKPGWILSSISNLIAYHLPATGEVLLIPTTYLRSYAGGWRDQYPKRKVPKAGYSTHGVLVPIEVVQAQAGWMYFDLKGGKTFKRAADGQFYGPGQAPKKDALQALQAGQGWDGERPGDGWEVRENKDGARWEREPQPEPGPESEPPGFGDQEFEEIVQNFGAIYTPIPSEPTRADPPAQAPIGTNPPAKYTQSGAQGARREGTGPNGAWDEFDDQFPDDPMRAKLRRKMAEVKRSGRAGGLVA